MSEYQPPEPQKKSFFDRLIDLFGIKNRTAAAIVKMVIVILACIGAAVAGNNAGAWAFGWDSIGQNAIIVTSVFLTFLGCRYLWVHKY
jgi:hypothetical protein